MSVSKNKSPLFWGLFICVLSALLISVGGLYFLRGNEIDLDQDESSNHYSYHYAFIVDNAEDSFWENVYQAAKEEGKKNDIYVERMVDNLTQNYSTEDQIKIAIAAKVDGILLQSSSKNIGSYMSQAMAENIQIVTMLNDNFYGERRAFVGVNGNDMGKSFAEQIKKNLSGKKEKVSILVDSYDQTNNNNLIISSIHKNLTSNLVQLNVKKLQSKNEFGVEETIRDMVLNTEERPDILVSLSANDTIYAYQSLVDYNLVGKITIIGSFDSKEIQSAVSKEIIHSVVTVDASNIGSKAVDILNEYRENGVVNEYHSIPCRVIDKRSLGRKEKE